MKCPNNSQIERIIEKAVPEFRKAVHELFRFRTGRPPARAFDIARGSNSATGIQTRSVCFLAILPVEDVERIEQQLAEMVNDSLNRKVAEFLQATGRTGEAIQ